MVLGAATAVVAVAGSLCASLRFRRGLRASVEDDRQLAAVMTSRFHAAVDGAPVGVLVVNLEGEVQLVNQRLRELLRATPGEKKSVFDHTLPEDREDISQGLVKLSDGKLDHLETDRLLVRSDGETVWCRITTSMLRDDAGNPSGFVAHVQDIEAERAAVEQLRSRTRWFASIVERSSDLITLFDAAGLVTWVSPSVGALLGREPEELLGLSVFEFIHQADEPRVRAALQEISEGRPTRVEYRVPGGEGDWIWLESTATDLLDDPDVRAIIALSRDVTERHNTTELLAHRAAHDPLTALANRAELERELDAHLSHSQRSGEPVAVAYLDLDGFKAVNDFHGHGAGDEVLRIVSDRLRQQVRGDDLIARVGGDEFVLVLPGAGRASAASTVERVRASMAQPMSIGGSAEPVRITVSIGLAMGAEDDTVGLLLHEADLALYEAKQRGRNRVEISIHGADAEGQESIERQIVAAGW